MTAAIVVAVGGGLGAAIRWAAARFLSHDSGFPVGITLVNVIGAFLLGWVVGTDSEVIWTVDAEIVVAGLLGGLTTFSTWMVDVDSAESSRMAGAIVAVPIALGLLAGVAGLVIGAATA